MANKSPRRTRRVNGGVPHVLPAFLERLARATRWEGDLSELVSEGVIKPGSARNPWLSDSPGRFGVDYLFAEILSKFDDGLSGPQKEEAAWRRFKEAEAQCSEANVRLSLDPSQFHFRGAQDRLALIESARRKIARLLGQFSWNEAAVGFSFTSGATVRLSRRKGDPAYKFSGIPESTFGNLDLATAAIRMVPSWERRLRMQGDAGLVNIVSDNKITTVPKNYKTHRVIAIEPDMNMYIQKGIASCIRRRLRKAGIDLRSQTMNQDLALLGSKTNGLATVDMSMASDTVCHQIVRLLLPPDWCAALEQCRTPSGVLPSGEKVLYRKFSSMGNGYTFELETLIFWGLSMAVCDSYGVSGRLVAVYGDDVIIPSSVASHFIDLLGFCGFNTNDKKTFIDGAFRESCGKHYLSGQDVTPFYVRSNVTTLMDLFLLHNQLRRWCDRNKWNDVWDRDEMRSLLSWLRSHAPSNWRRPRIPDGIGDGAFIGTFDECCPRPANTYTPGKLGRRDGWEGYLVEILAETTEHGTFGELGFGIYKSNSFTPVKSPPSVEGFMLKLLSSERTPQALDFLRDPVEGSISLRPRVQVLTTLVLQYPLEGF